MVNLEWEASMYGTIVNAISIIVGSLIGLTLRNRLSKRQIESSKKAVGLMVVFIGIRMLFYEAPLLAVLLALVLGALIGEAIDLDSRIRRVGDKLKSSLGSQSNFTEGFYSSTILFATGPMAILGPITEATKGDTSLLMSKSFLDGFSSLAMATSMGPSVAFSSIPIFIYQGFMYLLGLLLGQFLPTRIINAITVAGGALVLGIGMNLLDIADIRVGNMIPSLLLVVPLVYLPLA